MTEAELEQWILLAKWGVERVRRFRTFMTGFASVPSSRDLILQWAEVMVAARANGRRIEAADAWIAATGVPYFPHGHLWGVIDWPRGLTCTFALPSVVGRLDVYPG